MKKMADWLVKGLASGLYLSYPIVSSRLGPWKHYTGAGLIGSLWGVLSAYWLPQDPAHCALAMLCVLLISVAISDRAYRVRGRATHGDVSGWVGTTFLKAPSDDFDETMRQVYERQQAVEELIANHEVALGMTYDQLDDYLEGKSVDPAIAERIETIFKRSRHKHHMPASLYDEWWQ